MSSSAMPVTYCDVLSMKMLLKHQVQETSQGSLQISQDRSQAPVLAVSMGGLMRRVRSQDASARSLHKR